MNGLELKDARIKSSWTQHDAARRLGITQGYLSMVECGSRPVSSDLARKAVEVFNMPATALPLRGFASEERGELLLKLAFGALGYPGFAYLKGEVRTNPAALLMEALDSEDLDSRVVEGLPWLLMSYPALDWNWLEWIAKVHDRQNRLAYVAWVASQVAADRGDAGVAATLAEKVQRLERSRLASEDTLCKGSMTEAERTWLRSRRSSVARHWNLLTDFSAEQLDYVF